MPRRLGLTVILSAAVMLAVALAVGGPAAAGSPPRASGPSSARGVARARITGRPILGTATTGIAAPSAASTALPSRRQQIRVLRGALRRMHRHYAEFASFTPGPQDILDYGISSLWLKGIDGAGRTVAVIEGWRDPGIARAVAGFDKTFGLPNPKITTIYPAGPLPRKCPPGMVALHSYGSCSAWRGELRLDVIAAHLMAPYARILISATPADTEIRADRAQQVAPPEMMKALEVVSRHHMADAISISDGTGESSYPNGRAEILAQSPGELAAAAAGIPVLNATGDCGVVQNLPVAKGQCRDVSPTRDTAAWDDSPWVTAVGGSVPNVSFQNGRRRGPDPLWHVGRPDAEFSEGAGHSSVFSRPAYQSGVSAKIRSSKRAVPDITMDAQDGTSEAAPLLGGLMALASQMNHGVVGPINPALYHVLGPTGEKDGISDVVKGNDSAETPKGKVTVPGFVARRGFDVASGWGTVFAPRFLPALVRATRASHGEAAVRHRARNQLSALEHAIRLSPRRVAPGGRCHLHAAGLLPHYPVKLRVGAHFITTLRAGPHGAVNYVIHPARLGLGRGRHRVTLQSMLITKTSSLQVS
jgi:hypothetical protein